MSDKSKEASAEEAPAPNLCALDGATTAVEPLQNFDFRKLPEKLEIVPIHHRLNRQRGLVVVFGRLLGVIGSEYVTFYEEVD